MSSPPAPDPHPVDPGLEIREARPDEVEELLPLMRGYCEFYEAEPADQGLRTMARALIEDGSQGFMLIVREASGLPLGFATVDWKWSSLKAARIGYLEDLFVDPEGRGKGIADALLEACAERCRELGMPAMEWQTAPDNHRAQKVYNRTGAGFDTYLEYDLKL